MKQNEAGEENFSRVARKDCVAQSERLFGKKEKLRDLTAWVGSQILFPCIPGTCLDTN